MKRFTFLLIALISSAVLDAQQFPMGAAQGNANPGSNRDNEFQCLPDAVFSQVYPTYDNAYFGDSFYGTKVAEDYAATGPFSTMRFFGGNFYSCTRGTSQTFVIDFYDGNPSSGGTLINSFTKTITPFPLNIFAPWGPTEIYQVDVDFGTTINQLNGWVSISRINPGDGCAFAWMSIENAAGNSLSSDGSFWYSNGDVALFFCLGGGEIPQEIPIANWALIIGIALIGITIFIRFRKLI